MGRFATRRVRGGGPPPVTALAFIVTAEKLAGAQLLLTYNRNIESIPFDPTDFTTSPGGTVGETINSQIGTELTITMSDNIFDEQFITYLGMATNVSSPQTIILV